MPSTCALSMRCCCRADIVRAACVNTSKKFCNAMSPAFSIKKSWWRPSVTACSSPRAASRNTRKQRVVGRARHAVLGSQLLPDLSGAERAAKGVMSVQQEVTRALARPDDFRDVPKTDPDYRQKTSGLQRDSMDDETPAFVVRDRNYVSARWPGDAHTFAKTLAGMLK